MFGLSNTALAWCTAYVAAIIFAFVHPIYGVYGYFLDYYGHPPMRWWGKALPELRWSLIIALVTLAAFLIRKYSLPELRVKSHPQSKWLVLLILTTFLVTVSPLAVWRNKDYPSSHNKEGYSREKKYLYWEWKDRCERLQKIWLHSHTKSLTVLIR